MILIPSQQNLCWMVLRWMTISYVYFHTSEILYYIFNISVVCLGIMSHIRSNTDDMNSFSWELVKIFITRSGNVHIAHLLDMCERTCCQVGNNFIFAFHSHIFRNCWHLNAYAHSINFHCESTCQVMCSVLVLLLSLTSWTAQSSTWCEDLNKAFPRCDEYCWYFYSFKINSCRVKNTCWYVSVCCATMISQVLSHAWLHVFMWYNRCVVWKLWTAYIKCMYFFSDVMLVDVTFICSLFCWFAMLLWWGPFALLAPLLS